MLDDVLRWVFFVPIAFIAAVVASGLSSIAAQLIFSEFIGFSTSGAAGAVAFIMTGFWVAPKKSNAVKWTLIAISTVFGILSAAGAMLGDDKLPGYNWNIDGSRLLGICQDVAR